MRAPDYILPGGRPFYLPQQHHIAPGQPNGAQQITVAQSTAAQSQLSAGAPEWRPQPRCRLRADAPAWCPTPAPAARAERPVNPTRNDDNAPSAPKRPVVPRRVHKRQRQTTTPRHLRPRPLHTFLDPSHPLRQGPPPTSQARRGQTNPPRHPKIHCRADFPPLQGAYWPPPSFPTKAAAMNPWTSTIPLALWLPPAPVSRPDTRRLSAPPNPQQDHRARRPTYPASPETTELQPSPRTRKRKRNPSLAVSSLSKHTPARPSLPAQLAGPLRDRWKQGILTMPQYHHFRNR